MREDQTEDEWRDDMECLRVELRPELDLSPLLAAYELGRLCNEMRFHLESAWILYSDRESNRTVEIWQWSGQLICRLGNDVSTKLTVYLHDCRKDWEAMFHAEWHSESIEEAVSNQNGYHDHGFENAMSQVGHLAATCGPVTRLLANMQMFICGGLPGKLQSAFKLGLCVDELIHPPLDDHYVHFSDLSCSVLHGSNGGNGENQESKKNWCSNGVKPIGRFLRLPDQRVRPWPIYEWHLRFDSLYIEFCKSSVIPIKRDFLEKSVSISDFIDKVKSQVEDTGDGTNGVDIPLSKQTIELSNSGRRLMERLDLRVDVMACSLEFAAQMKPISLNPRLCRILTFFLNRGQEPTRTKWISQNWNLFVPGKTSLSEDSVRTAISLLNSALRGSGSEISSSVDGYRLTGLHISGPNLKR